MGQLYCDPLYVIQDSLFLLVVDQLAYRILHNHGPTMCPMTRTLPRCRREMDAWWLSRTAPACGYIFGLEINALLLDNDSAWESQLVSFSIVASPVPLRVSDVHLRPLLHKTV